MRSPRLRIMGIALAAAVTSCDRATEFGGNVTVIASSRLAKTAIPVVPRPPATLANPVLPTPNRDVIVRGTPQRPKAAATVPPVLTRRPRTFVDPPLPPELLDDGGLIPLPPRSSPSGETVP